MVAHCTIDVTSFFTKLVSVRQLSSPHYYLCVERRGGREVGVSPRHIQKPFPFKTTRQIKSRPDLLQSMDRTVSGAVRGERREESVPKVYSSCE